MFRTANATTRKFTWPVILYCRKISGKCTGGVGALVIVNNEGWFLTAYHIFQEYERLGTGDKLAKDTEAQEAAIRADAALDKAERNKRLKVLPRLGNDDIHRGGAWWGKDNLQVSFTEALPAVDVVLGRIAAFDPTWVSTYPAFKDPTKGKDAEGNFETGVSLCKLGFPLRNVEPIFDAATQRFTFASGTLPLPFFPLDGIYTRTVEIELQGATQPPPWPQKCIETSTPGLRGQSGGPTFDTNGTVWAIQSKTMHYHLDFDAKIKRGGKEEVIPQFLNVGLGASVEAFIPLLHKHNVKFTLAKY